MCESCIVKQREINRLRGIIRDFERHIAFEVTGFGQIREFDTLEDALNEVKPYKELPLGCRPGIRKIYKEEIEEGCHD